MNHFWRMKPSFFNCAARLPASGGSIEKPRQLPYTGTGIWVGPPSRRNTGAPSARPRRSHSALSM
jgi:hypothetical protein